MNIGRLSALIAAMMSAGPAIAMRAPSLPDMRKAILSGGGKGKRKHRAGGAPARRYGSARSKYMPHQSERECSRRRGQMARGWKL